MITLPKELDAKDLYVDMPACGRLRIRPSFLNGQVVQCKFELGKAGGCLCAMLDAVTKLFSANLQMGIPLHEMLDKFDGISCQGAGWDDGVKYSSCVDAIAKKLRKYCEAEAMSNE